RVVLSQAYRLHLSSRSFPTRRSSDLGHEPAGRTLGAIRTASPPRGLRRSAHVPGAVGQQRPRRLDPALRRRHGGPRRGPAARVPGHRALVGVGGARRGHTVSLALLGAAILGLGMFGPVLVRWSAPLLMRAPRLASGLLFGTLVAWSAAAVAVCLALAGTISGPQLFPASFTDVCRRCLASAGPFSAAPAIDVPVPAAALLLLPLLGIAVQLVLGTWRAFRRAASTRAVVDEVLAVGHRTEVAGHDVLLVPDPRPLAFTLPRRRGGMVVSHGLLEALPPEQLRAVLEHEAAHLAQHHHMILALLDVFAGPMQRIPLVAAVLDAVPLLLEVAADDASRHHTGTPAL